MKSALIVTGNLRTFENCIDCFEEIIEKFDCDIFICMSNYQYDLHPYISNTHKCFNENVLTLEQVLRTINGCKNFAKNIKRLELIDKHEENEQFTNDFLPRLNRDKKWIGADIFKQYCKIKNCAEMVTKYERDNNIKYNYVIKTRFDCVCDVNTFPNFPLGEHELHSVSNWSDIVFIANDATMISEICDGILSLFLNKSYMDLNVCENVHTMLRHVIISKQYVNKHIVANLDRNYDALFDTNVTLVTCFYNINRDKWGNYSRSIDKYFENCKHVLNKKNPIIIFTTEEYNDRCIEIRKKTDKNMAYTKIINIPFEQLMYYDLIERIREIQLGNINNIYPECERVCPEFCVPEYIVVINNKTNFLKQVATENAYNSTIFQWVDFGLHPNVFDNNANVFDEHYFSNIFYKKDKIRLVSFLEATEGTKINRVTLYNSHYSTTSAGLIGGNLRAINELHELSKQEFELMMSNNCMNQEQYIFYYLMCANKNLFDCSIIRNWNDLCNSYFKNRIKVALCMSGHLRSYESCKENINANITSVLKHHGFEVDTFLSTWNNSSYKNNDNEIIKNNFTKVKSEEYDKRVFVEKFSTNQYLQFPGLCGSETASNASSMIYKIGDVFNVMEEYSEQQNKTYDIVFRIRPDITYNGIISVSMLKMCLLNNNVCIYMPLFHGKYESVTKSMMDHYFCGDYNSMKIIMKTYYSISELILTDCPHTGEGFLWKHAQNNNLNIERFQCSYGVVRQNNKYEVVFN